MIVGRSRLSEGVHGMVDPRFDGGGPFGLENCSNSTSNNSSTQNNKYSTTALEEAEGFSSDVPHPRGFFAFLRRERILTWNAASRRWWLPACFSEVIVWGPSLVVVYSFPLALQPLIPNVIGIISVVVMTDLAG